MTPRHAALAIAAAFLLVGFFNIDQYGETWDEQPVSRRAHFTEAWVREVWSTGTVPSRERLYEIVDAVRVDWHHPVMFATSVRLVGSVAKRFGMAPLPAQHLLTLVVSAAGLWFIFLVGRQIAGDRAAAVGTLLTALYPPFIAHAHYNPKDVPVMAMTAAALYTLCRARERGRGDVLAALMCAATVNTKLDGLAVFAIFGAALAASGVRPSRDVLLRGLRFFGWFALFTIAMWPMLVSDPLLPLRSLMHWTLDFREGGVVELYLGRTEAHGEHPWHYAAVWLLLTTPVPVVLLMAAGGARTLRQVREGPDRFGAALLLAWIKSTPGGGSPSERSMTPGTFATAAATSLA